MSDQQTLRFDYTSEKLSDARLLLCDLFPYYAQGLYSMVPVQVRIEELKTMAVDQYWRLYYHPDFLERCQVFEVAAVLLHELLHLLRNHHERIERNGFEPKLGNLAADAEINDDVDAHARHCASIKRDFSLPEDSVNPRLFGFPDGLFMEEYYEMLYAMRQRIMKMIEDGEISLDMTSGEQGSKPKWEQGAPRDGVPSRGIKPEEAVLVRTRVAEALSQFAAKHPGRVPGGLERWAESILTPKVPWQRELRSVVRGIVTQISSAGTEVTWRRMNRRQAVYGDIVFPSTEIKVPKVTVVIDTSGSMDAVEQLPQCLAELKGILRALNCLAPVRVLSVDASLQTAKEVFDASQVELKGGGGTDMGVGILEAASARPKPDFIIVLTDGFTPWPEVPPVSTKVIVCLVGAGEGPEWAKTIKITK